MITVKNVTKKYGKFKAVDNISFEINDGEIIGLLGPNGAGKSTTMNILTGFIEPTEGEVIINGYNISKKPKKAKKCIGYMPEGVPLYKDMTVKEFVTYMAELKGVKKEQIKESVDQAIQDTWLQNVRKVLIRNLSKGYKQRVSMAGALVGNPEIIILDEPTVGLDPKQITEIRNLIKDLGKKHTVILSSHILSEVSQICNKVIIINKGKIPIVVGGTGLYIDSLIYEIEYQDIQFDENYRKELEKQVEEKGLDYLYKKAKEIDPQAIEKISQNDKKRILRILEIYKATGKNKTQQEIESRKKEVEYDYHVYAIDWDREELYNRINKRVDIMIKQGLIEEVKKILEKYKEFPTAMQGLGYKEVVEYLEGKTTKEEMIEKIKMETRRYAKRQLTWFRKNKQTIWLKGKDNLQNNIKIILEGIN